MPKHGENIYKRRDIRYEGRYVIGRGASGKTLAGSTVRGILHLLSAGMRYVQEDGLIPQNPCRRIRLGPPRRTEQRVLTQRKCMRWQQFLH